ncbi:MAG: bifunctional folylpolyglutamate synthase/dihydrofolate synthase [Tepidibacter sp.]|jgi:dihydrofolate synthase/folylpolyglutamate synthase|uniref:bifunctional folylpolyglutamate synthase/dihydrofolate synthase n=1 Tax=Tepidibacter sp. TaxID=2529387 RepID=UPI0025ED0957|nr:folylpolyglutamate synthase/dihydrofolate synthase family protein [Tepidibacter sp.]MCT4507789.1 bifunctional folylpolyglutamate synthase/dihydrofolate synthase [Tepidibacter sp.]
MNYNEALEYIHGTYKFGRVLGLDNITKLLSLLDNPQDDLNIIHVAGTNGKGSTCSFINSMLISSGHKVGLYTSPYLESFTERIRIDSENIQENELARVTEIVKSKVDDMVKEGFNHPTEFEIVTAIAFYYYKEQNVDFVVLEVGMGGRFDATNVIKNPLINVITPISIDHTDYLGDTLEKIAYEKGGIIKENCEVIMYPQNKESEAVIKKIAKEKNCTLTMANIEDKEITKMDILGQVFNCKVKDTVYENLEIQLMGKHQVNNAIVALNVINILKDKYDLKISDKDIYEGLKNTKWAGRIEVLKKDPLFIIDGAHNEDGANSLCNTIDNYMEDKSITLVLGMLKDKDVESVCEILIPRCKNIITTKPNNPRAMKSDELKEIINKLNKDCTSCDNIDEAVRLALKNSSKNDAIICAGSLYMIGNIRRMVKKGDF